MTLFAATTALLLLAAVSQNSALKRNRRETFASYSGSVNGQQYGGTYHKPDNGPAVIKKFGNEPQLGSFAGGAFGSTYEPQFPFVNTPSFQDPPDNFYPNYFKQLRDNFDRSVAQQQAAFNAARNSFLSNFNGGATRPSFGPGDGNIASGIFPDNPVSNPNTNTQYEIVDPQPGNNVYSVSKTTKTQSSNVNGVEKSNKNTETIINDNGNVRTFVDNDDEV